jgi:hypothetical protein
MSTRRNKKRDISKPDDEAKVDFVFKTAKNGKKLQLTKFGRELSGKFTEAMAKTTGEPVSNRLVSQFTRQCIHTETNARSSYIFLNIPDPPASLPVPPSGVERRKSVLNTKRHS